MAIVPLLLRGLRAFGCRRLLVFKSWRCRDKIFCVFVFVKQRSNQIQNSSSYEATLYETLISINLIKHYLKKHNDTVFLSVLGFDYYEIKYNRIHNNTSGFYSPQLRDCIIPDYVWKYKFCLFYKYLNDYAVHISKKIIPGLIYD